ncbi:energy transducer TonB [Thalassotalea fusca]
MKLLTLVLLSTLFITACSEEVKYNNAQTQIIERVNPKYPIQAARDKVEGYVKLSFDINESGETANIKVVDEIPENVFSKQAILAVSKWKYEPQVVNGKPVVQKMIAVQLDFKLGD